MNWNNVDLSEESSERDANLVDGLTFDTLLLEIHCNIKEISRFSVRAQFIEDLKSRTEEANKIFEANLDNIVKQAKKERASKWNTIGSI